MTTHPPIPPKSEFFIMVSVDDTYCEDCQALREAGEATPIVPYFEPDSQWLGNRDCDCICIEHMDEKAQRIIAAVAEVEWRKRAERWHDLAGALVARMIRIQRTSKGTTRSIRRVLDARKEGYYRLLQQCHDNADAWRKWGEA